MLVVQLHPHLKNRQQGTICTLERARMRHNSTRGRRLPVQSLGTAEECRKKRELTTVSIRKHKREEIRKKRHLAAGLAAAVPPLQSLPLQQAQPQQVPAEALQSPFTPAEQVVEMFRRATTPAELAAATERLVCGRAPATSTVQHVPHAALAAEHALARGNGKPCVRRPHCANQHARVLQAAPDTWFARSRSPALSSSITHREQAHIHNRE